MRPIQKEFLALPSVIHDHGKAAGSGNDELLQFFMRMAAAHRSRWHIVEVIHALNEEGNVAIPLDERKISPVIRNFWQVDYTCGFRRFFQLILGRGSLGTVI